MSSPPDTVPDARLLAPHHAPLAWPAVHGVPPHLANLVGLPVSAIDTPALVVDLDAMARNLQRMADFADKHDVKFRPHAKMHKSAVLARLQMQAGASGVCVQKTSEAEALAGGGVGNIYISNQVVAPDKLERVAALAQRLADTGGQLAIAVDSMEGVLGLAAAMARLPEERRATIDVFVEIDVGHGRCGVAPGTAAVVLAQTIGHSPGLRFAGLQAYQGRAQHLRLPQERRDAIATAVAGIQETARQLQAAGLLVGLVTGAGTGTFALEAASGVYGELQAGSFLLMDADYARNQRDPAQPQFEHALFVKSQVMSTNGEHAVCDAGHKSHAIDSGLPLVYPLHPGPELIYFNGGDEHGILRTSEDGQALPRIGDVIWLVPGHCDPTVNLHDYLIGVTGGLLHGTVERIISVDARGALT
jgi:D-serine deaminase-like pyridoxal phosphate-dependent protein